MLPTPLNSSLHVRAWSSHPITLGIFRIYEINIAILYKERSVLLWLEGDNPSCKIILRRVRACVCACIYVRDPRIRYNIVISKLVARHES